MKKRKPCTFCSVLNRSVHLYIFEEADWYSASLNSECGDFSIFLKDNRDNHVMRFNILFCPFCGKDLHKSLKGDQHGIEN
jgi:hypothetical protein